MEWEKRKKQTTIFDTAFEKGLSGTSRLHDLFIKMEGITPAEYKHGGKNLHINYSFAESPFGNIVVASTDKGICYMAFAEEEPKEVWCYKLISPMLHSSEKRI